MGISDCGEILDMDKDMPVDTLALPATKRLRRYGTEPAQVHAFQILKKHAASLWPMTWRGGRATCTKAKARIAVENLRKRLLASATMQQAFAELAREHSDDVSAPQGGDLGHLERKDGALPPTVEDAVFALKTGELSELLETDQGVHLVFR